MHSDDFFAGAALAGRPASDDDDVYRHDPREKQAVIAHVGEPPDYIPASRMHLHGIYVTALLVRRWDNPYGELARGPEGVGLTELRQLHAERRLRFIQRIDHVEALITEPDAPGWF